MPSFFNKFFGEEPPDSVDVPSGVQTSYYNPDRGELCVNMLFKDKNNLIASVKDYSVRVVRREYRVVDRTRILWKLRCKNNYSTVVCRWGLRASFKTKTGYWKITKYGRPHTCISTSVGIEHKNLNSDMVAHKLLGVVHCDPSYEIKYIIENVKDKYGYQISYTKAWQSLKRAMKIAYGTWESSVQLLPKYMCALSKYNPSTVVEWKHLRANIEMSKTPNYVFWALRPCVDGFRHCRKITSVDGRHLYIKYKHKMLIGVTLDGNNQVLPLAFAIVDEETTYSWKWFLENLGRHVVHGENGVCLISNRHKGIVRATEDIPYFQPPYSVHRFCLRHDNQLWSDYACQKYEKWARKSSEHRVAKYDVREQNASVATVGRPSRGQHMQMSDTGILQLSSCTTTWLDVKEEEFVGTERLE
ncbi:uncharacterized protein LOC142549994 [Primulina tabacum]|uniref:uncharacterized protein LOC142549994 n=1 Tax=Primulina tabacum TaxID=48773 RepID=UPI003F5AB5E9